MSMDYERRLRPPLTVRIRPGHEQIINVENADQIQVIGEQPRLKSGAERFVTFLFGAVFATGDLGLAIGLLVWGLREVWERAL
jgi:tetrahydromethanopterin S-methyltransferase subunit F